MRLEDEWEYVKAVASWCVEFRLALVPALLTAVSFIVTCIFPSRPRCTTQGSLRIESVQEGEKIRNISLYFGLWN